MNFFKLIRVPNLIIILFTQSLIYFGLLYPSFKENKIPQALGLNGFIQMYVITMLITISGYLINDIFDLHIDSINKKSKQLVGNWISIKMTKLLYILTLILGFVLSILYAIPNNADHLIFIYPLVCGILAFYSYKLKGSVLVGNIVIALFSTGVVAIILLFETNALSLLKAVDGLSFATNRLIITAFMIFAFLSGLLREIVKDIEDLEGDRKGNAKTAPVVLGLHKSKTIALAIGMLQFAFLFFWMIHDINGLHFTLRFYGLILLIMLIRILIKLKNAEKSTEFHKISQQIKIFMGFGLLYIILYYLIFHI